MKRLLIFLTIGVGFLLFTVTWVSAQAVYIVQPGDSLSKIAVQFGTTVQAIAEANDIANPRLIVVGQSLLIPGGDGVMTNVASSAPVVSAQPAIRADGAYVVQTGDSLSKIAAKFGVSMVAIAEVNGIEDYGVVVLGQELVIPGVVVAAAEGGGEDTAVSAPPPTPSPVGSNLLLNPSFEEDWYHPNDVPELQIPQHWVFQWDEGPTGFGGNPWDVWVRPEVRVVPSSQLPAAERPLFIAHGDRTLKVFKGGGAINFRILSEVQLLPGTYELSVKVVPDLVAGYWEGEKYAPSDPYLGEVRFIVGNNSTDWFAPAVFQQNSLTHRFTINSTQTIPVGLGVRGKFAIENDGWFIDDWSLVKVGG